MNVPWSDVVPSALAAAFFRLNTAGFYNIKSVGSLKFSVCLLAP